MDIRRNERINSNLKYLEVTKKGDSNYIKFHEQQFNQVYRSTISFFNWLEELNLLTVKSKKSICDVGVGQGANLIYAANRFSNSIFKGIDINPDLIKKGNDLINNKSLNNCSLIVDDLYNLNASHINRYDGITCICVLPFLPDFKIPVEKMIELNAEWIAITGLFFEGNVSCKAILNDFSGSHELESYYNTYSLPIVKKVFHDNGYKNFSFIPFEIDIDLPKPTNKGMGTYTENLKDGRRLQVSGPILMNWYFVVAKKN